MYRYIFLISILLISIIPVVFASYSNIYQNPVTLKGFREIGTLNTNQEVIVTIFVPLKNLDLLYYYAGATSNPASPLYHKFLSPQEVQQLFLPTEEYNQILNYVKNSGFQVLFTALNSVIVVKGTVGQVEKYLGTKYTVYSNGSITYYTNYGYPKINAYVYSSNVSIIFFAHPSTLITESMLKSFQQEINQTFPLEGYWPTVLQKVYNVTTEGENTTIGILDFYGDPYIVQQLAYFDKVTGLPNPPNFTIVPIGPYNPNLGIANGWAGEISLDVEVAHAIAPKANITLYIANPNIPLPAIIAYITSQNKVDTLSQSFIIPESVFSSLFNGPLFYSCVILSDEYYALGSAEGITFLASSGDAGGSGYSNGPIGTVGYPSTSPFVTSVGGTTVYLQFPNGSYYQTAWSNYGFVPNNLNCGGSTGGVSIIEPKPWYQWGLLTPSTYPNGKLIPEISANANVYPGIYIVLPGNVTGITGGTSESSPLTAGLLSTIESYTHNRIGLLNPILTYMAEKYYGKAIEPITFGYNIPWVAYYGYNLVTGYGTINAGYFENILSTINLSSKELNVIVNVYNTSIPTIPPQQFYPRQHILVTANITYPNGSPVQTGEFKALIENYLGNLTTFNLTYNPLTKLWAGSGILPNNASGVLFVYVYGSEDGLKGIGYYETFSGYYITFDYTTTFIPVYAELGNAELGITLSNSYFEAPIGVMNITLDIYSYNITTNAYTFVTTLSVPIKNGVGVIDLPPDLSVGDLLIIAEGNAYGFDAFTNGIYMQTLFILPQVVVEPGSVSPGQFITIEGSIIPPVNLPSSTFQDALQGTNITAKLVSSNGVVINEANIPLSPNGIYFGYLYIPKNTSPGLYNVLLFATYYSYALNTTIQGFYYGQIYVSNQATISVKSVNYAFEGQTVFIYANITNGTNEIKFGMFSATVYPSSLSFNYTTISSIIEIPLWYNPKIGEWEGNFTLPSAISAGNLTYLAGQGYFGVPFKVLITGISALGNPTTTNSGNAYTINVLPYTLFTNQTLDKTLPSYASLVNVKILNVSGNLLNDFLTNVVIVNSNVKILNGNISNLVIRNSTVFIMQSNANNITLYNSTLYAIGGSINGLNVINSKVVPINVHIQGLYPELPTITISLPSKNVTGTVNVTVNVVGEDVSRINVYLNGNLISSFTTNGTHIVTLNTQNYPDGGYNLTVTAIQSDGLSSSNSSYLYFENGLTNLNTKVNLISNQLTNVSNSLSSSISSLRTTSLEYQSISLAIGIIAIVLAILALVRRRR
ncbi:peptidase S53 [Sulfolobus sp. E5-1-F]|uniref:S53 family peptidase n=1 Tax=Saccharolobus sp. E5-1-F TaxID=2663019 RepID=UPI001295EB97|nr:protease pro-enzyme activation domain-containing protein [Sulfolobus sp. E5-1-F]QGA54203.1 peptidase S53 [Sulfolobus sp. E5-1-F]